MEVYPSIKTKVLQELNSIVEELNLVESIIKDAETS